MALVLSSYMLVSSELMVNGWLPVTSFFANSIFFSSSSFLFSNCYSILLWVTSLTCKQVSCCRICFWTDTISVSGLARAFLNFGIGGSDAALLHEGDGLTGFSPNISRKLEGSSINGSYEKGRPPLVLGSSTLVSFILALLLHATASPMEQKILF